MTIICSIFKMNIDTLAIKCIREKGNLRIRIACVDYCSHKYVACPHFEADRQLEIVAKDGYAILKGCMYKVHKENG